MTTRCARYGECASSSGFLSLFLLCGLISQIFFQEKGDKMRDESERRRKTTRIMSIEYGAKRKSVHGCSATLVFTTIMYIFQIKLNTTQHPPLI